MKESKELVQEQMYQLKKINIAWPGKSKNH